MVEGAVRAPARRRFLLLLGWAGAVALVIAVFPVLVRGELPDPLAVGWNYSGYPSKSAGLGEYVLLSLLKWAVVAGVWAVFAHRWPWGPALPGAALGGFGVLLAGGVVQTVLANVGVSDFREAAPPGGHGWVALGCVLGGWLGWRLANRG